MLCFRYRKLLVPYAEGALDGAARSRVEMHLSRCASCRAELECVKSVSDALRSSDVPAAEPSSDLWARVRERIVAQPAPPHRRFAVPQTAFTFACVLLIGLVGWSFYARILAPEEIPRAASRSAEVLKNAAPVAKTKTAPPDYSDGTASERLSSSGKPGSPAASKPSEPQVVAKAPESPAAFSEVADAEVLKAAPRTDYPIAPAPAVGAAAPERKAAPYEGYAPQQPALSSGVEPAKERSKPDADYAPLGGKQMNEGQRGRAARSYYQAYLNSNPEEWPAITESVEKAGALKITAEQAEADFNAHGGKMAGLVLYTLQSRQNDASAMAATARRLVSLHPEDPGLWLKLGEACEAAGDRSAAVDAYRKAASFSDKDISARANANLQRLKAASPGG